MKKKLIIGLGALAVSLAVMPLFAAFEAHVINVTAKIENSLFVHPESKNFNTVFPQEYHEQSFFITVSESFSATDQRRVLNIDYDIKQKPKPRPEKVDQLGGIESARDWCHTNIPDPVGSTYDSGDQAWQDYLVNCYPTLCPYISKHPDNFPSPGNDFGLEAFHDPEIVVANGKINKDIDPADQWIIDLAVPCFEGSCSQDWADFVHSLNPFVQNPDDYMAPSDMNSEVFGCDLWVEVTNVY
ncbi:MAG: hypothetical protein NUV64_02960 [Parcubacteria group bacterium]|nr:hypothetical protein [Parcubacteria group bacterium]MCR4342829.1 hypothetical protein [Patescibacteria group bacterium]